VPKPNHPNSKKPSHTPPVKAKPTPPPQAAAPGEAPPPAPPERNVEVPSDLPLLPVPDFVREELAKLEIVCEESELLLLAKYLSYLLEVNKQFNLTAIRDPEQAWRRHIVDSLTLLPFLAEIEPEPIAQPVSGDAAPTTPIAKTAPFPLIIDVGTGGGLPGVPLAITMPGAHVALLESTGKKTKFLQLCEKQLPLPNVQVLAGRAEVWGQNRFHRGRYDVAVCRAMGPIGEVLECTLPFLKLGGVLLAMKGPSVEEELKSAGDALVILGAGDLQVIDAYPDAFGQNTVVVRVVKENETPHEYPRPPGTARVTPL